MLQHLYGRACHNVCERCTTGVRYYGGCTILLVVLGCRVWCASISQQLMECCMLWGGWSLCVGNAIVSLCRCITAWDFARVAAGFPSSGMCSPSHCFELNWATSVCDQTNAACGKPAYGCLLVCKTRSGQTAEHRARHNTAQRCQGTGLELQLLQSTPKRLVAHHKYRDGCTSSRTSFHSMLTFV